MQRLLRNKNGLTLVEAIVTMAIIGILLSMVFSVHISGTKMTGKGSTQADVQNDVRLVANYITSQIRTANSVEILSALPATLDIQKKYFYVSGNTVKHFTLGTDIDLLHETSVGFIPLLEFEKNAGNGKVLNFAIECTYKGQNYSIESEILAQNIAASGNIQGLTGTVVAYSCPLTDTETVMVDKARLKINDTNAFLKPETDGSWTLNPPPDPNLLSLPSTGYNGSTITWSSSDESVVRDDGTVLRSGINAGNKIAVLTATLTKGVITTTKYFTVHVCDLDPLVIGNTSTEPVSPSAIYEHIFTATGGFTAYSFSTADTLYGLTLDVNGRISGALNAGVTGFNFTLTVKDGYSPTPNEVSETINIMAAP